MDSDHKHEVGVWVRMGMNNPEVSDEAQGAAPEGSPTTPPPVPPATAATTPPPPRKGFFGPRKPRRPRPHPFEGEASPPAEANIDARLVTILWLGLSAAFAWMGWTLAQNYGWIHSEAVRSDLWETGTAILAFASVILMGLGLWLKKPRPMLVAAGWILFSFFWAMTARDLFVREEEDYVNSAAAILLGVFGGNYIAYQAWLDKVRGVSTLAVRFLTITAVVAAGTFFTIAKITPARVWLINRVGEQTKWSLDAFGFGSKLGLQFHVDETDIFGPVLFHYPDTYCDPHRGDPIGEYCAANDLDVYTEAPAPESLFDQLLLYTPDGDLRIIPVSIILACTAIQSIMLFAGLFMGTEAPWQKRLRWSVVVGAIIYALNLLRNTLVIWAYGRGHASFFMIHNVWAKVLSLTALIGIAVVAFKRFPEFFHALSSVLDLPQRDGPIERTLRMGKRRPGLETDA